VSYQGDLTLEQTLYFTFTTVDADGAPTTLAGTPSLAAYENLGATQITAGITLDDDMDGKTGLHGVTIAATAANGYEAGKDYAVVIEAGTVDGTSVVGYTVGSFSIENRFSNIVAISGDKTAADNAELMFDGTGYAGGTTKLAVDAVAVSGDTGAADNLEAAYDGTGYANTGSTIAMAAASLSNIKDHGDINWQSSPATYTSLVQTGSTASAIILDTDAATDTDAYVGQFAEVAYDADGYRDGALITAHNTGTDTITLDRSLRRTPTTADTVTIRVDAPAGYAEFVRTELATELARVDVALSTLATAAALTTVDGRLPSALISGRMDASVGAMQSNVVTDAAVATDMDSYQAKITLTEDVDETDTTDVYVVDWYKNGAPIESGITSPVITVTPVVTGSAIITAAAMTEIGTTEAYRYAATGAEKVSNGVAYFVQVQATIDGSTRKARTTVRG
jgi:hypothetical protein